MCNQCSNIYHQAGYKIVEIPLPGASLGSTSFAIKEECHTVTQEPVGPSNFFEKEDKPQVPRPTVTVKTKDLIFISTQTIPQPTTCSTEKQTESWDKHQIMDKWKKEYVILQDKILQEHKLFWKNHIYSNWEALEQVLQHSRTQKKENKELKSKLLLMFDLVQKLLAARKPSSNYSLFLAERLAFFQIKEIKDGRPHEVFRPEQFVKTFAEASTSD